MKRKRNIHKEAFSKIVKYEIAMGRKDARDVSDQKEGYDVVSSDRNIEVKVTSSKTIYPNVSLEPTAWEKFRKDPKAWLYIVYNFDEKPRLVMIPRDQIKVFQIKIPQPRTFIEFPPEIKRELMDNSKPLEEAS